jgi:hypothetical protein
MSERQVAQQQRNSCNGNVAQHARRDASPHIWLGPGVVVAALLGLACANGGPAARPDGDASSIDTGVEAGLVPSCDEDCASRGMWCSLNRCTSDPCYYAEANGKSITGCLFYTVEADNVAADESATTSFLVANPGPDPANVELDLAQPPSTGSSWMKLTTGQVPPGGSARFGVSGFEVAGVGVTARSALRLSSDRPVTLAQIESDDQQTVATSSGGTMILPLQALGAGYRVVTYPQESTTDVQMAAGSRGGAARLIVVGTRDGTTVTFTPTTAVTHDPSGVIPDLPAEQPYTFQLDDGDVFQLYSGADGEDLTGGDLSATNPVAVFSGNISTSYGSMAFGINSADMAHEQMPPELAWSKAYVAAALTPQASVGCDSFFGAPGASIWRVLSGRDGTQVTVAGPGIPSFSFALDAGMVQTIVETGSFVVTSSNYPILVTQGIDCEPSLSLAVAIDETTTLYQSLPLAVPPSFDLQLAIVRRNGAEVDLDGTPISGFQPVGQGFDVAIVALDPCAPVGGSGVCTHLVTSPVGFGASLRGMDVGSSFALTVPVLAGCNPVVDCPD